MKGQAALSLLLLLVLLAVAIEPSTTATTITTLKSSSSSSTESPPTTTTTAAMPTSTAKFVEPKRKKATESINKLKSAHKVVVMEPKVDDDIIKKIQEDEIQKVIKAQAKKGTKPVPIRVPLSKSSIIAAAHGSYNTSDSQAMKELLEAEDMVYNEDIDAEDEDDDDDDYDDEDDEDDEDDDDEDEDGDDDDDGEITDYEEVMSDCPSYCRCVGQFAAITTAKCIKLLDDQIFSPSIIHLKIESAGDISLGAHALRKLGLKQLESFSVVDTKIVELDRTAFDGLTKLSVVNLTHNGLVYIHPDTFQNNSQLSLLTIADNPLKIMSSRRSSNDYLLDAPSVTELDFSSNQITRLPRRTFAKMPNLVYISLRNNKLNNIEKDLFAPLDSLVELDLSHNNLADLPTDVFEDKNLMTLRLSGNSLTSLSVIRARKLATLDVSMNQLNAISKDDLNNVPNLDQLYLNSNNLKKIHRHAFSRLEELTYLDLSNNNLMSLNDHHFRANTRLQVLLLSNNPDLETLPIFKANAQEFERFSIYRFECENCGLTFIESGTFDAMQAMTRLNLARNSLTGLPRDLLQLLSSLRELDLSQNQFEKLDDDTFKGAVSLTKLSLAMNSFPMGVRIAPFLKAPNLLRLDLSYCGMQRVWSDAKTSTFKSLRFLSLHENRLSRVALDELRAVPNLSSLDLSHNPLQCDDDLSIAIQWLMDNKVTPTEATRAMGSMKHDLDYVANGSTSSTSSSSVEPIDQWSDLAKRLCDSWEGGPPPRPAPKKSTKTSSVTQKEQTVPSSTPEIVQTIFDEPGPFIKFDFTDDANDGANKLDFGQGHTSSNNNNDEKLEFAWNADDQEYEEIAVATAAGSRYRDWYTDALWPAVTVILITLAVLLLAAHLAVCMAKRRGRRPVIRPPILLRPNLVVDSKNCGLVYKPLQEEIATPHMPKRGSFYSSSTFHYDKIVPESV